MNPQANSPDRWEEDLTDFFAALDRENAAFSLNVTRQGAFYRDTVRPALEAAAAALRRHGRTGEVGLDANRQYLIVRRADDAVEFQYAVLAEARIEGVTPYIHCWFEENTWEEKPAGPEQQADKDSQPEAKEDDAEDEDQPDKKDADAKDDKKDDKPARTKTIELLGTWAADRAVESVTRDEILADFTAHYQEAVTRLRTHLHARPLPGAAEQP